MKGKTTPNIPDRKAYIREQIIRIIPSLAAKTFRMVLSSDLTVADCKRQTGYVCLVEDTVYVIEEEREKAHYPLESLSEFRADSGIGEVSLECRYQNKLLVLCRGDMSHQNEYATIAKRLNHYKETGLWDADYDKTYNRYCPKCGRKYRHGSSICMHCVDKKKMFARIWEIAAPYKWTLLLSIFLFFIITGLNMIGPYINRVLVDDYITPRAVQAFSGFCMVILSMFILHLVTNGISIFRSISLISAGNKIIVRLREMVFDKVQMLSVSKISKRTAGEIMQRVTGDTAEIQNFVVYRLSDIIEQSLIFIGISIMLFMENWKLALMILLPIPLVSVSFRIFHRYIHRIYHKQWVIGAKSSTILHDIFSGIRVVKAFGMEHFEMEKYDKITYEQAVISAKNERFYSIFNPIINFFMRTGEFFLLFYVGNAILKGDMTLGEMAQFSSYVSMLYSGPVFLIANLQRQLTRLFTSMVKVFDLLDEEVDIGDKEEAKNIEIKGQITFDNVHFGYDDATEVLKGISLDIQPGEFIGIVGKSGVGKSTLINLVMRIYDVEEGAIRIDGTDIRDLSQECLRSQIGVVLQETFLFSGSIYDNIAYAKPEATRDEIITASKIAGAHAFIMKLPDGYNTKVGEKGHTLSGGERQRISIARALLHDPRILILDEATASLDTETEKQIQDALQKLSKNRTTLAIAHRLSTLRNATRLIVIDKGKIAEVGTHEELIRMQGIYYNLVMAQRQMSKMTHDEK
ncbi:MAG: ABC transporter ATP-binding protein [Eubacteriales bacterium]